MRTIDEVIESFERMAKSAREKARSIKPVESNIVFINELFELAEEEEQIANWLKELKRLTGRSCENCKHHYENDCGSGAMPCAECKQIANDYFEAKEAEE